VAEIYPGRTLCTITHSIRADVSATGRRRSETVISDSMSVIIVAWRFEIDRTRLYDRSCGGQPAVVADNVICSARSDALRLSTIMPNLTAVSDNDRTEEMVGCRAALNVKHTEHISPAEVTPDGAGKEVRGRVRRRKKWGRKESRGEGRGIEEREGVG